MTKVESILAADGNVDKEVDKVQVPEKKVDEPAAGNEEAEEQKRPLSPATNKGTWASMFKT